MPLVEIKDFNALISNKPFFWSTSKKQTRILWQTYQNYFYPAGNSLDYLYHRNYYKLIGIDLSRQKNTSIPQKMNFVGNLEKGDGATMFFNSEKKQETIVNFSLESLIVTK